VLFVDYIAEHLNPNGRAGIIVPEGIIFQSGTAYKKLRKMLVGHSLYAVVSLPAGVFNPYSGVKTSILMLDKNLAKKTDKILFVKINNDGFGLGAQRREVRGSDLPLALEVIKRYKRSIIENKEFEFDADEVKLASMIEKKIIAKSGDYNLGGDRYKEALVYSGKWDFVDLGDVCEIKTGKKDVNQGNPNGKYPFFTCAKKHTFSDEFSFDTEALLIAGNGDVGSVQYCRGKFEAYQRTYVLFDFKKITAKYLFFVLEATLKKIISKQKLGNTMPYIKLGMLKGFKIPLPPLEVQERIVAKLDSYQKIIDGARQVVENYKPHMEIDPAWDMVELGELFEKITEGVEPKSLDEEGVYIGLENITQGSGCLDGDIVKKHGEIKSTKLVFKPKDILYGKLRPNLNKVWLADCSGICSTDIFVLRSKQNMEVFFYSNYLRNDRLNQEVLRGVKGAQLPRVGWYYFSKIKVPFPEMTIQKNVAESFRLEQSIIEGNKKLIEIYEQKINDRIAKVWGEKTV